MPIIAPSLLASDFARIEQESQMLENSAADWFHLDIMDGIFVPNISFGLPVVEAYRRHSRKPLDVHLMIVQPERYLEDFQKVGADILTIHYEASQHLHRSLQAIRGLGMKAGVALNPHTPVELLRDTLEEIDVVCLMSVNPGFGGQKFIEHTYAKVARLKQMIREASCHTLIEIDGGVSLSNGPALLQSGADVLVAGSFVFKSDNPTATIAELKNL